MFGVILLADPSLLLPSLANQNDYRLDDYPNFNLGVIIALSGSACSGCAYLTMRLLGTTVSSVTTTFYFAVFSVPACFLASVALGDRFVEPLNMESVILLFTLGFFGWVA